MEIEDLIAVMGTTSGEMFNEAAKAIIKESESKWRRCSSIRV